ncbi:MAG: PorP/SprF family type IX secretion system membrane protein [Chitinophagales bacterium]
MRTLILITILYIGIDCFAQDAHYSQFYAIPSKTNPAFTGFFNNDYFVAASYRTQWNTVTVPYQTVGATMEMSLIKNKHPNSFVGVGIEMMHDQAGSTNFQTNQISVNVSYLQVLDVERNHVIGVGFQNGMMMKSFDYSKATFGNQFNGFDGFDQSIGPNEAGLNTKQIDYNLAIGGVYSYAPAANKNIYAGFSVFNVTKPNISFFDGTEIRLDPRYVATVGGEMKLKGSWSILPSVLFQSQGVNKEIVLGSFVKYSLIQNRKERLAINAGVWYRVKDAIIPAIKLEYKNINVTANFDFNISKLTKASKAVGGAEISISYSGNLFKEHVKPNKPVHCPSFIF